MLLETNSNNLRHFVLLSSNLLHSNSALLHYTHLLLSPTCLPMTTSTASSLFPTMKILYQIVVISRRWTSSRASVLRFVMTTLRESYLIRDMLAGGCIAEGAAEWQEGKLLVPSSFHLVTRCWYSRLRKQYVVPPSPTPHMFMSYESGLSRYEEHSK